MFNLNKIYTNNTQTRFLCDCVCSSPQIAQNIENGFQMFVRMYYRFADLYVKGNTLILDTPDLEKTKELANRLNDAMKNMK